MEYLLFLLFVLFSIISALLERRKRSRRLEEQRQRREQAQQQEQQPRIEEEETEEEVGWPFGRDPFEIEPPQPVETQVERIAREALARERELLKAERQALEVERLALEAARQGRKGHQRGQVHRPPEPEPEAPTRPVRVGRWRLDPKRARDAIVYAEILGPPKAERSENV
jgi:hypothetical protein